MKIKTVTIVTSGCQIYICRLWNRSPPLSLSLYPSFIERFKANKVTKGETKRKEGGIKRASLLLPRKNAEIFPMITLVYHGFFLPSVKEIKLAERYLWLYRSNVERESLSKEEIAI